MNIIAKNNSKIVTKIIIPNLQCIKEKIIYQIGPNEKHLVKFTELFEESMVFSGIHTSFK